MARTLFGEWKPDQPAHLNDGLAAADGVYPIANGYAPLKTFAPMQNGTLAARCIGAGGYRYTGSAYLFAATASNIYTYSTSGYASVASGLAGSQAIGVRFCPYSSFMMATNGSDPIKKFDPTSPGAMTNLGGSPPTARFLAVVRGFLIAGYAGGSPLRVAWSDTGNPANWTAGGSSQAGIFDMPTGGDITGLAGGEYGLIFQERRIVRMTYTADSSIWQFDEIATDTGCIAPKSFATFGKTSFFWSAKGFMACDGTSVQAIGSEKVDRYFQGMISSTYFDAMSAVVDPVNSLYIVAVPSGNPTSAVLIYNYAMQRWTSAALPTECLFSALSLSTSIEDLDAVYGNLDSITISLDSASLRGGFPLLLAFDVSHRLGALSGPNMAATFTDALREQAPGYLSHIRGIRPLTNAPSLTVSVRGQNSLSDTPEETEYTFRTAFGVFPTRENWSLTQVSLSLADGANWTFVQGYDADAVQGNRL